MEIKKVTPEMVAELRKPLPREAITKHPTKTYLSSIKTIFSIERMNDVFGLGGWVDRYEIISVGEPRPGKNRKGEDVILPPWVVAKGYLEVPEYGIKREAYGGNDNEDLGDAYKGACTDALSKMLSTLYIGMDVYKGNPNAAPSKNEPVAVGDDVSNDFLYEKERGIMDCVVLKAEYFPAKGAKKEAVVLAINSPEPLPNKASCWQTKLLPALRELKGNEKVTLAVEEVVKGDKTYINITDIRFIGDVAYKDGQPMSVDPLTITKEDEPPF